jgi:hypothetical protein
MPIVTPDFPGYDYLIMEYPTLDIRTIALTLGRINRFAGNTKMFWPVLMHAITVSSLVSETAVVHALLHDAGEIYIGDIPSPFKSYLISEFEDLALKHIYKRLELSLRGFKLHARISFNISAFLGLLSRYLLWQDKK